MSYIPAAEKRELDVLTDSIHAHLIRIEADPVLNDATLADGRPFKRCFHAQAFRRGRSVMVTYVSYQGQSALDLDTARRFSAALEAGYLGRHHEHSLARFENDGSHA